MFVNSVPKEHNFQGTYLHVIIVNLQQHDAFTNCTFYMYVATDFVLDLDAHYPRLTNQAQCLLTEATQQ